MSAASLSKCGGALFQISHSPKYPSAPPPSDQTPLVLGLMPRISPVDAPMCGALFACVLQVSQTDWYRARLVTDGNFTGPNFMHGLFCSVLNPFAEQIKLRQTWPSLAPASDAAAAGEFFCRFYSSSLFVELPVAFIVAELIVTHTECLCPQFTSHAFSAHLICSCCPYRLRFGCWFIRRKICKPCCPGSKLPPGK